MLGFRNLSMVGLATVLILVATAITNAQPGGRGRPGRRGGPPGMMMQRGGGMGIGLLRLEQVQEELELVDDQKAEIQKLTQEVMEKMRGQFQGLRDLSEEERREKMVELREKAQEQGKAVQKQLGEILLPHQSERLREISLQQQGPGALGQPDVVEALGITPEQREELKEAGQAIREKMTSAFQDLREVPQEERREKMEKLSKQVRKEAEESFQEILTKDQWDKFHEMMGEPFELDRERAFRGHRPGGEAGPGRGRRPSGEGQRRKPREEGSRQRSR